MRILSRTIVGILPRSVVERRVRATLDTVSTSIAAGNLRIFAEIGSVVGRFLVAFSDDRAADREKLAGFMQTLVPGPVDTGGQDLLKRGLSSWYEAAFETDRDVRAEKIFFGNCLIGLHEQTRVQPDIDEALEAPLRLTVGDELGRWLFDRPVIGRMPLRRPLQRLADAVEYAVMRLIARGLREGTTRMMMRLRLPSGDLRLGRAVLSSLSTPIPPELATIDLPEVRDFVTEHTGRDARGATDWASLPDRMRFIIALFRAVQKDRAFFDPPFADGRAEA